MPRAMGSVDARIWAEEAGRLSDDPRPALRLTRAALEQGEEGPGAGDAQAGRVGRREARTGRRRGHARRSNRPDVLRGAFAGDAALPTGDGA